MDISTITFVIAIVVIGLLLTATIRRDFSERRRLRQRDIQRQINHLRARRRPAERP